MVKTLHIYSDFDGTITTQDSLVVLLDRYADPSWRNLERKIREEGFPEKLALPMMMDLVRAEWGEVRDHLLQCIDLDSHFKFFVGWSKLRQAQLTILSGGFEEIIKIFLDREGLSNLNYRANRLRITGGSWKVFPARGNALCENQNHCKCGSMSSDNSGLRVYIGDGHTDFCPAKGADIIFAKAHLLSHARKLNLHCYEFKNFEDVQRHLEMILHADGPLKQAQA
ncbi:MAG: hypothetical protein COV44_03470 [Deltaproteobacteria bacterium CG11_big_fil_rev_8_21_14_0_20_45_16]|nr:MAG: hypothetical protein COV44_03470 [Deltaproteobacteria bacterium CG11_big_fil_rev_8_21_14_0_20_45_16]